MNGQRRITEDQWDELKITKPIVLEFYADWCAPCKQQGPIISRLAQEFPEIDFYKVNIDREKDWFSYETRDGAIPMIQFIFTIDERNNFYSKATVTGFMPYSEVRDSCQSILRRYNNIKRKNMIPLKESTVASDTIIYIEGEKYHLALSGYVDMGTSVKWAAYNIGAKRPEQIGEYYAWGEINSKSAYTWYNYKHINASTIGTKSPQILKYGPLIDRYEYLQIQDDVAKQKWGGNWRMPAREDYLDLLQDTEWDTFTLRGIEGVVILCSKTHNALFFPLTGWMSKDGLLDPEIGEYWTLNLLYTQSPSLTYYETPDMSYFFLVDIPNENITTTYTGRSVGLPVRPVYDPNWQ